MINPISTSPAAPALIAAPSPSGEKTATGTDGFHRIVDELIGSSVRADTKADNAVMEVALGRSDDVPGAALAVGMADLSFRRVLEVRNKLMDAYQEIMRMQV
jgi:flagellar hook-basal body complex protein FliE